MLIGIIDYGVGNLGSIRNAFAYPLAHVLNHLGAKVVLESRPENLAHYDKLILPGVGAFGAARKIITERGFDSAIIEFASSGKYLLGICLGMQLLFERSYEFGIHDGLGLLQGEVVLFTHAPRLPHIGWNICTPTQSTHPLLDGFEHTKDLYLYFIHSYHAIAHKANTIAECVYGESFPAIVGYENILGIQPHPEKSHKTGLQILKNFLML